MRLRNLWLGAAAIAALGACKADETLSVPNPDNPDVALSLSTPDGIQAILRNGFNQVLGATHGTTTALWPGLTTMAFESYGAVANFGMNLRAQMPRSVIDNQVANSTQAENLRDFQQTSMRARLVANAIQALDSLTGAGKSLGSTSADLRARSFGFFALGLANGNLALIYDSIGVIRPGMTPGEGTELVGYQQGMVEAIKMLDTALAVAAQATGSNTFSIPNDWMRLYNQSQMTQAQYVQMVRSLRARLRAGVARNPTERAAVNWSAVVADAAAGIEQNITLDLDNNKGWGASWINQLAAYSTWHMMPYHVIGMADTGTTATRTLVSAEPQGNYQTWNAAPRDTKTQFLILTPDSRFPKGNTRAAQVATSPPCTADSCPPLPDTYFRARTAAGAGDAWGGSYYDFVRFRSYRQNAQVGPWIWMARAEIEMLRAEGLMRLGRDAEAVPFVNRTRLINNLPAFPDGSNRNTRAPLHPGGGPASCVPRTPTGPDYTLECGTMWEAMKYEKRLETAFTGYAQWFVDSRGWGDLPQGTPTMYPVPYQELQARGKSLAELYNSQPQWGAGVSTYGWGTGSR